ncbi:MAG: hypothetical protein MJ064_07990 [Lachnospiraceae bacterium]|nr:hypothetical protein [Lachnospiraceae bacterium]
MKKRIFTILLLLCVIGSTVQGAKADSDWYTYTYNFWGDETASPDAYYVSNIFYGPNFGEGVGTLNDPESMFVIDDLIYICDSKNNRIIELQYVDDVFKLIRIIRTVQVSVDKADQMKVDKGDQVVLDFKHPYDIFVKKIDDETRKKVYGEYLGELYVPTSEDLEKAPEEETTEDGETPDGETPDGETPDGEEQSASADNAEDAEMTTTEAPDAEPVEGAEDGSEDGAEDGNDSEPVDGVQNDVREKLNRDYDLFIADYDNHRIIHCDYNLNVIGVVHNPVDETLKGEYIFLPSKFVVDDAYRYYVQATNINSGLMEFTKDGTFTQYIGASPVTVTLIQRLWRRIQTKEQKKRTKQYVPTEYNNVTLDEKGFLYVTTDSISDDDLNKGMAKPIRKLNSMGDDILVRNGNSNPIGDLKYYGVIGQKDMEGASAFVDVVTFENQTYCCLDKKRGRLFFYDFQGNMLYAFGNAGMNAGCFSKPSAIGKLDEETLLVLDRKLGTITIFKMSRFGQLVNEAIGLYRIGKYDESADVWQEVLKYNGNYDLAYVGVGRSLLRKGEYKEAMNKFEVVRDRTNYSKAFKYYREQVVEKNIVWFLAVLIALIVIPKIIRWILRIRKEIQEA